MRHDDSTPAPRARGAIDMEPDVAAFRSALSDGIGDGIDRVEGTGVHVAGLRVDDERPGVAQDAYELHRIHRRRITRHRDDRIGAEPDPRADRATEVLFGASDQGDGWGPAEPGSFDIDAVRSQNMMAGREQPDRVRRLGTRREPHGGVSEKIQHVEDPATGNLFSGNRRRSVLGKHGVLVPRRDEVGTARPGGPPLTRARYAPIRVPTIRAPAMWQLTATSRATPSSGRSVTGARASRVAASTGGPTGRSSSDSNQSKAAQPLIEGRTVIDGLHRRAPS